MCRPGSRPNAAPANVTASSALWCTRKIGSARAFRARARNVGRISITRPIWANASASAAGDGGNRFDCSAPGTPTALIGWPFCTSTANAPAPSTSSAAPHERRCPCRATRTPSCHGAHHTASTFTQPRSRATRAIGIAKPQPPSLRNNGVRPSSTTCTARNHSGVTTRWPIVITVCWGNPRSDSPKRTTAQPPSSTATGTTNRRTRRSHGVADRAAAKPPVKKNSPRVWSTQLTGASPGSHRNGLSTTNPVSTSTTDVTSQWPATTPPIASARTASITGSRFTACPLSRSAPWRPATPCRG
nr:hypothetical protein [Saccharothrix tamanrassetensis]